MSNDMRGLRPQLRKLMPAPQRFGTAENTLPRDLSHPIDAAILHLHTGRVQSIGDYGGAVLVIKP
jgi:hypothetical protein